MLRTSPFPNPARSRPGTDTGAGTVTAVDDSASVVLPAPRRPALLTPRQVRTTVVAALVCGIAGNLGVSDNGAGAGLALYFLLCTVALGALVSERAFAHAGGADGASGAGPTPRRLTPRRLTLGCAMFFALLLLVRDSSTLQAFNSIVVLLSLTLSVALSPGTGLSLFALRLRDLAITVVTFVRDSVFGSLQFVLTDAARFFAFGRSERDAALTSAVARSVAIGIALVAVFGTLLAAGDPVFSHSLAWIGEWNAPAVLEHVAKTGVFMWPALGLLWLARRRVARITLQQPGDPSPSSAAAHFWFDGLFGSARALNRLDALVALGSMNAVFALFVLLQLRTLFGGQSYVMATTGLTIAEYARGGFFALTFTAALVIGTLLALDSALRQDGLAKWPVARRLSLSLLALMGVVLTSAVIRMSLYVGAFGISVDRITALAVMGWVAIVAVLFTLTVLRGRHARLVPGALAAAAAVLIVLNVIDVDAFATRSAISRAGADRPFDSDYIAGSLDGDGAPALVQTLMDGRLNTVPPPAAAPGALPGTVSQIVPTKPPVILSDACHASTLLLKRWGAAAPHSVAAWTWGSWRARRAVARHADALASNCPMVHEQVTVNR